MLAEKESKHAIEIKIVPFDQCADRRGGNDPREAQRTRGGASTDSLNGCRHHAPLRRLLPRVDYTQTTVTFKLAGNRLRRHLADTQDRGSIPPRSRPPKRCT